MKKGFLKVAAATLAIVPAMGLFSACSLFGKKDTNEQATPEQLEQRYGILKTAMGKMAQKGSYTSTEVKEEYTNTNVNNSLFTNNAWVDQQANVTSETKKEKEISTLDATTGQYANIEYEWKDNAWQRTESKDDEFVVKTGTGDETKYVRYFTENEYDYELSSNVPTKKAEYVSDDHAIHAYGLGKGMDTMDQMMSDEGYEKALENLEMFGMLMSMPLSTGLQMAGFDTDEDFDVNTNTKFNIKKDGNNYSLEVELTLNLTEKPKEEQTQVADPVVPPTTLVFNEAYAKMKFQIDYNANELKSMKTDSSFRMDIATETATAKSHTVTDSGEKSETSIVYQYTASEMPATFTGYPTDGIENKEVEVEYYLDRSEVWALGDSYAWGTDVTEQVKQDLPEATITHTYIDGWYYDKECTRPVGEEDTFNFKSWEEPKFYAKTKADEGYAVVVENYGTLHEYGYFSTLNRLDTESFAWVNAKRTVVVKLDTDTYALPTAETTTTSLTEFGFTNYAFDKIVDVDGKAVTSLTLADGGVYEIRICVKATQAQA